MPAGAADRYASVKFITGDNHGSGMVLGMTGAALASGQLISKLLQQM